MANNLIQLRYLDPPDVLHSRLIRVVKARSSAHDPLPHVYHVDASGIRIESEFAAVT